MPAASLRIASISSALTAERAAECQRESNQSGFQFMEDMSQRLKVALIRVLILSYADIKSYLLISDIKL